MLKPNPVGHHTTLTTTKIDEIIAAVKDVYVQNQVAHRCHLSPKTLDQWLDYGLRDRDAGRTESVYAQLTHRYYFARSEIVREKLDRLSACPRNYQALTWILEKSFREDFGKDSDEIKKFLELAEQIIGIKSHGKESQHAKEGKELDSKSDPQI